MKDTSNNRSISGIDNEIEQMEEQIRRLKQEREALRKPEVKNTNAEKYDSMTIEQIYKLVREFMLKNGVQEAPVSTAMLEDEFGCKHINELIRKSYIIKVGKGVTIGI